MYSVVLLATLTVSTAAPAHGTCRGCYGGYAPYSSYSCYGCYGGYAPYSSYSGYGCRGCYGCGGCNGVYIVPTYGCYGAGAGYHGGCYGGYGVWQGAPVFGGCYGCHGGQSGYGIPIPVPDVRPGAVDPFPPVNPNPAEKKTEPEGKKPEVIPVPKEKKLDDKKIPVPDDKKIGEEGQARARIRIDIPEGGRLFVDGNRITGATGERIFQTPLLNPGQKYFYDVRIEIDRAGETVADQRRIIVSSGLEVAVTFSNLVPAGTTTVRAQD